jgi:hypothetical protein
VSEVLEAIKNGERVHVFEGETDVEAARKLGLTATTNFGGALKFSDKLVPFFSGATVIVNQDNDERGKEHALDVALRLHGTADVIKLMPPFESVGEGGDFKDWLANGGTKEKYLQMVDQMPLYRPELSEALVVGTLLSDVESKPIRWCWKQRIALGKLNMLDGDPGLGKSLVGVDLGARVSVGAKMPDGTDGIGPCGVVLLSAEDDLADTVRPRWIKAGGDPTRLLHVFQIKAGGKERTVTIPEDVSVIEAAIKRVGARVVIIDPLSAFWGPNVRTHIDTDVRQALNPLKDMAERLDVAVIMVRHLNKSHSGNAIYRGGGSIGIIGAARSGLIVGKHPENDSIRIVAPSKVNISKEAPSLSFTITSDGEDEPPRIVWGGKTDVQANDLAVAPQSEEKRTALEDAKEWLAELLDGGSVEAEVVETKARKAEIKMATLRRAKKKVNVVSEKIGDKWYWMLPIPPDDGGGQGAQGGGGKEDAHLQKMSILKKVR